MLDPTTNGFLVDENDTVLSLLEAREKMALAEFVTYRKAASREKDLHKMARKNLAQNAYYAKNLFRFQVDAISQFGETGRWLNVIPEHFSVKQWTVESAKFRLAMAPQYAREFADFEEAVQLPRLQVAVTRAENSPEPEAVAAACLTAKPE